MIIVIFDELFSAKNTPIKQADAIMLNYPLNWNYSIDIMHNDLMFYETLMSSRTPAMTWSWFTIGWKWVNELSKMRSYFLKSYQDYIIQPFKVTLLLHIETLFSFCMRAGIIWWGFSYLNVIRMRKDQFHFRKLGSLLERVTQKLNTEVLNLKSKYHRHIYHDIWFSL